MQGVSLEESWLSAWINAIQMMYLVKKLIERHRHRKKDCPSHLSVSYTLTFPVEQTSYVPATCTRPLQLFMPWDLDRYDFDSAWKRPVPQCSGPRRRQWVMLRVEVVPQVSFIDWCFKNGPKASDQLTSQPEAPHLQMYQIIRTASCDQMSGKRRPEPWRTTLNAVTFSLHFWH